MGSTGLQACERMTRLCSLGLEHVGCCQYVHVSTYYMCMYVYTVSIYIYIYIYIHTHTRL